MQSKQIVVFLIDCNSINRDSGVTGPVENTSSLPWNYNYHCRVPLRNVQVNRVLPATGSPIYPYIGCTWRQYLVL